jgi:hypothetical protein
MAHYVIHYFQADLKELAKDTMVKQGSQVISLQVKKAAHGYTIIKVE